MDNLLDALMRQSGLTARYLASGVGGLGATFADPLAVAMNAGLDAVGSDYRFPQQYDALQQAMTDIGLPEPEGMLEKGVGFASEIGVPDPTDSARVISALNHYIDPNLISQAMTVFHGSPHKWDKVDLSKVGTGEGAQAYGHGFYSAEQRGVAQDYADKLGTKKFSDLNERFGSIEVNGKSFDEIGLTDRDGTFADLAYGKDRTGAGIDSLLGGRTREQALAETARKNEARWSELANDPEYPFADYASDHQKKWNEVVKSIESGGKIETPQGHLYELDLPDETIDKMLDWDKPLSEQQGMIDALHRAANDGDQFADDILSVDLDYEGDALTGDLLYDKLKYAMGDDPSIASDYLNSLGIPGIKYLDGTSRSAGEGTRNFVVFDENAITPLKRNNEPIK